jgi:hypothetical protein
MLLIHEQRKLSSREKIGKKEKVKACPKEPGDPTRNQYVHHPIPLSEAGYVVIPI